MMCTERKIGSFGQYSSIREIWGVSDGFEGFFDEKLRKNVEKSGGWRGCLRGRF
jgi:hypothetical protein